jgi:hypothetical protein
MSVCSVETLNLLSSLYDGEVAGCSEYPLLFQRSAEILEYPYRFFGHIHSVVVACFYGVN